MDAWQLNQLSWDYAVSRHNLVKGDLASAIAAGPGYLHHEIAALLPSASEQTIVQLFCNDGRELLSLLRNGGRGVGVDFSGHAIRLARTLNDQLHYNCLFIQEEVSSWLAAAAGSNYDVFFTSLGSLWWVADLSSYFRFVRSCTVLGGSYIIWEFHPFLHTLDDTLSLVSDYPFHSTARFHPSGVENYVSTVAAYHITDEQSHLTMPFANPYPVRDYLHGIAAIVTAASHAGWRITRMDEYPYILGERYLESLHNYGRQHFRIPPGMPQLPLTFTMTLQAV
jgi:hypothetical protein